MYFHGVFKVRRSFQPTSQLYNIWMSVPTFLYEQLPAKITGSLFCVLYSVNLRFFDKLQPIIAHFRSCFVCILTEKRKTGFNNLIKRQTYGSINSPRCPALWFVYILMPSKEEWVLAQLGSQHKCVDRPVWPVFPDYLSVSYDYGKFNRKRSPYTS